MALPLLSDGMGGIFTPRLDAQVLGFLAALALAVIIVLTAAPAFAITRIDLHQAMRPPRAGKLRGALIAGQVAGGFALLTVTALLLLSYANVTSVDPGFTTRDLLIAGVGIPEVRYDTDAKMARFYERALGEMAAIPGVQSVTVASTLPLVNSHGARVRLSNSQAPDTELPLVRIAMVSPPYFETLRVPVKAGRAFHATDREGHPRVAMVNEAFVRALGSNVGEQLRLSWWNGAHAKWVPWEVVGVAADVHQQALDRPAAPQVYLPLYQFSSEGALFALRARETDHAAVSAAMVKAVHAVDSSIQSIRVRPMLNDIGTSLDERKLTLRLLSAFAIVVLLLCASALFGLTAYAVRERTRELASRRALGAEASSVIGVVFRHALSWSVLGMAVGMILAWWAARTVRSQLFGVSTGDPMAWAAALVALSLAVTAGCWLPARRAASVDPAVALRNE